MEGFFAKLSLFRENYVEGTEEKDLARQGFSLNNA